MSKTDPGRPFAEHLRDAPLAPDTSAKVVLTGEVRRCRSDDRFVFVSPEIGTVTLDVAAVTDYEPVEGGLTRLTLDAASVRELSTAPSGTGAVPFLMATPHHASPEVIRAQIRNAEMSAAIMDVETAFIKDVWGDEPVKLRL